MSELQTLRKRERAAEARARKAIEAWRSAQRERENFEALLDEARQEGLAAMMATKPGSSHAEPSRPVIH
jgi:hypothetical protein